ncbi:MAG: cytochrome C [Sulfuritalea sp.]|nr:cytochrome C [Sulfuritalea sp.]MBK9349582.1 cytochrome C [Sulfuritalea sp.]
MKRQLALPFLLAALSLPALADNYSLPKNVAFEEECTSCHIAYPPQMLDAHSWQHMMNGLANHFGTDASIDDRRRTAIADFLARNSGGRKTGRTVDAKGNPLLRITETARFERKHRDVTAATWKRASIKSPANCAACHAQAAAGDYSERSISIPK